jgi:7-keto-8-aminopelargonate synthetase-like enzyme
MVQRLSSSGYVFSASLPPYLASAAIAAVDYLEANSSVLSYLRANIATLLSGTFYTFCSSFFVCSVNLLHSRI